MKKEVAVQLYGSLNLIALNKNPPVLTSHNKIASCLRCNRKRYDVCY